MQTLSTPGDTSWFVHDRFGLFIHWGLYSLPARHEWVKCRERTTDAEYDRYFRHFDPDLYDPTQWADAAAGAGMKYFVITTKHHEGFCLWDSDLTEYKSTRTPCGKDLLKPVVEAFSARGLRTGFYHSLLDWHHPHYVVDSRNHPRAQDGEAAIRAANEGRDQSAYAAYLRGQVRELLTRFGRVDALWFDFSFPDKEHPRDFTKGKGRDAWESEALYRMIRELQPHVILTDRLDLDMPLSGGDMKTPEQSQPRQWVTIRHEGSDVPVVWEACQTFSGSWGYARDEMDWRSSEQLIQTLIDCVSKGGNLLLNVGPTGRGEIDARALDRLADIGTWMKRHSRSIYGCTQAPAEFETPQDCRLTYHPEKKRLYVHVFAWPYKHLHLDGAFRERVAYAQLLSDASELKMGLDDWHAQHVPTGQQTLTLNLPQRRPDEAVPVIELFLR